MVEYGLMIIPENLGQAFIATIDCGLKYKGKVAEIAVKNRNLLGKTAVRKRLCPRENEASTSVPHRFHSYVKSISHFHYNSNLKYNYRFCVSNWSIIHFLN